DVSFSLAESLAAQLADELRSRGSRARMISRDQATGKDVPLGYETDPVKALAQAINSAAGGYAKREVALETSKAITGRHFTFDEFAAQHKNHDQIQTAEKLLNSLKDNTTAETERIAKIESQIKELQQERIGTATETTSAKQRRLYQIGALYDEKTKIEKWKNDDDARGIKKDLATLRRQIHQEYQTYIKENMIHPKRQKNAYSDAVSATQNVLRNDEAADRALGTLKGMASVWFLGGRLSSAAINLTAMGTTVPASMKTYGGIPISRTAGHIARASKAYMSMTTGKGQLSASDRAILEEINARGWVAAQLNMEAINALKSGPSKKYGRAVEFLMTPFKITEEFNRGVTILAAYKGVRAADPKISKEDALKKAKTISDKAHGIYDKGNTPAVLRAGGGLNALSSIYIFQKFFHNYLATMAQMIGKKEAVASTYMLLSPVAFGGLGASLATPVVQAIFRVVGADDPEERIYQVFEDAFGTTASDMVRFGLPGLAGVNFKGSLAPNLPDFAGPVDMLGPIGGMFRNIWEGGRFILRGDQYKGIERMTPAFIGSAMKGYREATEGVTTKGGAPVFFGDGPVRGDTGTALLKLVGFNPVKTSKPREIQWNETKLRRTYQDRKRSLTDRAIKYLLKPPMEKDPVEWQEIIVDIRKLNARIRANGLTRYVSLITLKTIATKLKKAKRPRKSERLRE
ncbi:MAG: PLxRFG domain-containing protein, partial [Desulfobacterales bacterium]|nr:PLxRFG domain-containing protein [Desulfobacterales bacterium]